MKIVSTNIGEKRTLTWKGTEFTTGIFKQSTNNIFLGSTDVAKDVVYDRKYHGGIDKACYAYSSDHYEYWKTKYPNLDWAYGMFGENLTLNGLNEKQIFIGDIFELGKAKIQVSEPRQPCSKLNLRFDSNQMVKEFIEYEMCGCYFRVLEEGEVRPNDELKLVLSDRTFSIHEVYCALYKLKPISTDRVIQMIDHPLLAITCKDALKKAWNI